MKVITRFAPSPTGYLHIGGARTALFNYLFARKHNGKFLLRIEDTDVKRSSKEATDAIFTSLKWLGLEWDNKVVFQSERKIRHKEAALKLIEENKAYYCFCTQDEIDVQRQEAINNNKHFIFHSPWREADPTTYPKDRQGVIRLKAPRDGITVIKDRLQGDVEIANDHLDDMVLLRSDGSPTYMLAVVVDDHDMEITHIIRGDDHLSNAARQIILYQALGFNVPVMVHIPLIHGADGAKLSKRHGALGADAYREMGFLPDALCNYLLRLGWSHGDDEVISRAQSIEWFNLEGLGRGAAKLDFDKMKHLNAHYIRNMDNEQLVKITIRLLEEYGVKNILQDNIARAMNSIKVRAELLVDLMKYTKLYLPAAEIICHTVTDQDIINVVVNILENLHDFSQNNIQNELKNLAISRGVKIGKLMEPIRILLTGIAHSPSLFEMMEIIGKQETIRRLKNRHVA